MRYKIPAIRKTCRRVDAELSCAVITTIYTRCLQKSLPTNPNLALLIAASDEIAHTLGEERYRELAETTSEELLDDIVTKVADATDRTTANDIDEEMHWIHRKMMQGHKGPRNVSQRVVIKLLKRFHPIK